MSKPQTRNSADLPRVKCTLECFCEYADIGAKKQVVNLEVAHDVLLNGTTERPPKMGLMPLVRCDKEINVTLIRPRLVVVHCRDRGALDPLSGCEFGRITI